MFRFITTALALLAFAKIEAADFKVYVNDRQVACEQLADLSYVDCDDAEFPIRVRIESASTADAFSVSPRSRQTEVQRDGNVISFTIEQPGYRFVRIDSRRLAIIARRASLLEPAADTISVLRFIPEGAEGLMTRYVQQALDYVSGTGLTLYFPAGRYTCGTLRVGSRCNIYLDRGALLQASDNRADFPTDGGRQEADHINNKANYTDNGEWMTFSRFILIDNARDVRIYGRGTIDGNGAVLRRQGKPANLVRIRNSQNIVIEGIVLRNPAAWNTHIHYSDSITIRGVKVINDPDVKNTDGFDPDSSTGVRIIDCFAYCSDDNVAVKSTNNLGLLRDVYDVEVRGCTFLTRKSALKVGTETKATTMKNIRFVDNDILMCDRGIVLYDYDGCRFENISFINNRFESCHKDNRRREIDFEIKNRSGKGSIRNILIKDCSFLEDFPNKPCFKALEGKHSIEGVVIENLRIAGRKLKAEDIECSGSIRKIKVK